MHPADVHATPQRTNAVRARAAAPPSAKAAHRDAKRARGAYACVRAAAAAVPNVSVACLCDATLGARAAAPPSAKAAHRDAKRARGAYACVRAAAAAAAAAALSVKAAHRLAKRRTHRARPSAAARRRILAIAL
jgi:hypothetical protein